MGVHRLDRKRRSGAPVAKDLRSDLRSLDLERVVHVHGSELAALYVVQSERLLLVHRRLMTRGRTPLGSRRAIGTRAWRAAPDSTCVQLKRLPGSSGDCFQSFSGARRASASATIHKSDLRPVGAPADDRIRPERAVSTPVRDCSFDRAATTSGRNSGRWSLLGQSQQRDPDAPARPRSQLEGGPGCRPAVTRRPDARPPPGHRHWDLRSRAQSVERGHRSVAQTRSRLPARRPHPRPATCGIVSPETSRSTPLSTIRSARTCSTSSACTFSARLISSSATVLSASSAVMADRPSSGS